MMMDRRDHFIQNTRIKSLFRNDGTKFFLYIRYRLCYWDALAHLIICRVTCEHCAEQKGSVWSSWTVRMQPTLHT